MVLDVVNSTDTPSPYGLYPCAVIVLLCDMVCIAGNIFILLAILKSPTLQKLPVSFLVSLSIVGLMFACLAVSPVVINYFAGKNTLSHGMCILQACISSLAPTIALWHVVFVILNQYVAVAHRDFQMHNNRATAMQLVFAWGLPVVIMTPSLLGQTGATAYHSGQLRCVPLISNSYAVVVFTNILCIALPVAIVTSLLILIYIHLRQTKHDAWSEDLTASANVPREDVNLCNIFAVLFGFILSGCVILIMNRELQRVSPPAGVLLFLDVLMWITGCAYPIVFPAMSEDFRKVMKGLGSCNKVEPEDNEEIQVEPVISRRRLTIIGPFDA